MNERIKPEPQKELSEKPICQWEPANRIEISSFLSPEPYSVSHYGIEDVFPQELFYKKDYSQKDSKKDNSDLRFAHSKLLYLAISNKKNLKEENFYFRLVSLPETHDKKLKMAILYSSDRITLDNFNKTLKESIETSNEIMKSLGVNSNKLIPNLPE